MFNEHVGESQTTLESLAIVESILEKQKLLGEKDGNVLLCFPHDDSSVLIKRNGQATPLLRAGAAVLDRYQEYQFDRGIYILPDDHNSQFSKVLRTIELLDENFSRLEAEVGANTFRRSMVWARFAQCRCK